MTTLPGGAYAIGRFVLGDKDYPLAWQAMMGTWLPASGYQPDDRCCFERYPSEHVDAAGRAQVEIVVPVRRLD